MPRWPVPEEKRKRRPNKQKYRFSTNEEKALIEWIKDQTALYDTTCDAYKKAGLKKRLYDERAATYTPTCTGKYT